MPLDFGQNMELFSLVYVPAGALYFFCLFHLVQWIAKTKLPASSACIVSMWVVSGVQACMAVVAAYIVTSAITHMIRDTHWLMEIYPYMFCGYLYYDVYAVFKCDKIKMMRKAQTSIQCPSDENQSSHSLKISDNNSSIKSRKAHTDSGRLLQNDNEENMSLKSQTTPPQKSAPTSDVEGRFRVADFTAFLKRQPLMMFHHMALPCLFLPVFVLYRGLGDYILGAFLFMEGFIPFNATREILKELQVARGGAVYVVNGVLLIVSFFVCRMLLIPGIMRQYGRSIGVHSWWQVPFHIPTFCTLSCLLLYSMFTYWFVLLVRTAHREIRLLLRGRNTASSS